MRRLCIFLFLLLLSSRVEGSNVVTATENDFDSIIKKSEIALVKFYAPWCGHCQELAPEWEKAADEVPSGAVLVDVDCTKETKLASRYSIEGYPTIILFRGGEKEDIYKGLRKSSSIVDYAKANIGPAVYHASTAEELTKLREDHATVCVGLTASANSDLSSVMNAVAKDLRSKLKFVIVTDPTILSDEKPESITVYRKGGEKEGFEGNIGVDELKVFLQSATLPFAGEITPETYMKYAELPKTTGWVLLKPSEEGSIQLKDQLQELGKKIRRDVMLLWVDAEQYSVGDSMSVPKDAKYPAFVIFDKETHFVLPSSEPASTERITDFVARFVKGELLPTIKSQPVPEEETVDGLTTIVGTTLDRYLSSGKDMLIEFFAPWCGHCKNLAPIYAKVAKEFESSDVVIASMDATANYVNSSLFDVSGFPTIFFVPHGGKPILYEGGRTFYDLYKFVREHSSVFKDKPTESAKAKESSDAANEGDL